MNEIIATIKMIADCLSSDQEKNALNEGAIEFKGETSFSLEVAKIDHFKRW